LIISLIFTTGAAFAQEASVGDIAAGLPPELSPWLMFQGAHVVVKTVMVGLCLASLATWTIALAKALEIQASRRKLAAALPELTECRTLAEAASNKAIADGFRGLVEAARAEIALSGEFDDANGVKERIASRLERLEAAAGRAMTRGAGVLATIGATAPFVGLFGTVWGIMNSFIGIARQHTTNLAVVAPGIAEALLATALGLAAAIPAVVIYNIFARSIAAYRALCADGSAAVFRIASRDLDRGAPGESANVAALRGGVQR
jgi:biopolymer transport protein ExbB